MARSRSRSAIVAGLLALVLMLSGCMELLERFGRDDPETRIMNAMDQFAADMESGENIKRLEGKGTSLEEGMGFDLEIEFGSNGVTRLNAAFGGFFSVTFYCSDAGARLISAGEEVLEQRSSADDCTLDDLSPEEEEGSTDFIVEDYLIISYEEDEDGWLVATVEDLEREDEALLTITVDDRDRLVALEMEDAEVRLVLDVVYGPQREIPLPVTTGRMPASVDHSEGFDGASYEFRILEVDEHAPVEEFRVDVYESSDGQSSDPWDEDAYKGTLTASFPLGASTTVTHDGYTFAWEESGDGLLGPGDVLVITNPEWSEWGPSDVDLFDVWAGSSVDESPLPAPGFALLTFVGLALVGFARRKR